MRKKTLINKAQLLKLILLLMVIMLPSLAMAQDDLPCGGDDPYATECSLDGWLSILMVGGVGYGTYAISKSKKRVEKNKIEKETTFKSIVSPL